MKTLEKYESIISKIKEHLQDDESKILFDARLAYLENENTDDYVKTVQAFYQDWRPSKELEDRISMVNPGGFIIFGCGDGGKSIERMLLSERRSEEVWFCDNYKNGKIVDGVKVLSVDEVIENYKDYLVIIGSYDHANDMYNQLVEAGYPNTNILLPESVILQWERGNQYFDVFKSQEEEVFVDAGSFDGLTITDFVKWTNGSYKRIYAFEPLSDMCRHIQEMDVPRTEILNCAAWNKKEDLHFTEARTSSSINSEGEVTVQGMDIDSAVKDDKVTYIKMDIEGSELKALEGARKTILKNHPKLAICIYHKMEDIIEIPSYILSLVPEYKFYIRQYASHICETVLYAEI